MTLQVCKGGASLSYLVKDFPNEDKPGRLKVGERVESMCTCFSAPR